MKLYLAAFKACRRSRNANPIQAIIEIIKTIYIITATTFLVKSENLITVSQQVAFHSPSYSLFSRAPSIYFSKKVF